MKQAAGQRPVRQHNAVTLSMLGVIALIYSTAAFNVVVPRMGYSVQGVSNMLVLTALAALAVGTFLQCIDAHPGRVPPGWQPDPEAEAAAVVQVKRRGGGLRRCKKCGEAKPPRTHHCKRCGICVLRMDHHCRWVNNCIGQGNHRAFLKMTVYLAAAALHALGLLLSMDSFLVQLALGWDEDSRHLATAGWQQRAAARSAAAARTGWRGPFWAHVLLQVAVTALALPVTLALCVLLGWNAFLALRGQTTIEYHEGVVARYGGQSGPDGDSSHGPFDLGPLDNLFSVCGDNPLAWPFPGRAAAGGDGLSFPSRWDRQQQRKAAELGAAPQ